MHYGEPETPRDSRQPIGLVGGMPQDGAGWIGSPAPSAVTWIGMPAAQGWVGGGQVQDTWIGVEQSRPQTTTPRERQQLAGRDLVRTDRGRGRGGRPVDRAKLPPFLQSHPRFRGHGD
ncbi:MAG TPA: hypothetical protein VF832_11300 [Longimicrobiales bacterium]